MVEKRVEADFRRLVAAAVAGERCPQSYPFGEISQASITALIAAGRIRSEVYSRNWRVVTILTGEHKGKQTAPAPWPGAQPYLINGRRADRAPAAATGQPWKPGSPLPVRKVAS